MDASACAAADTRSEIFEQLYETALPGLYKYALYYLGNREDAFDAVQDAALDAFAGFATLRDANKFDGWIFRILTVKCKRIISMRIKKRGEMQFNVFAERDVMNSPDFTAAVDLMDKISRLADDEREIILLSLVGGYSSSEIAGLLRKPRGTIRSRLSRALEKLRDETN